MSSERAADLGQTIRLVTLPFRPFQHLVDDQLACLAVARRHAGGVAQDHRRPKQRNRRFVP